MRCILGNDLTLEDLVDRLFAFELSNFDNYKPKSLESTFKAKLFLKDSDEKKQKKKKRKIKYVSSDSDTDEEDVEQLEALLARRFHRGNGKFKGKLPIICFNWNEVGHIVSRCIQKKNYRCRDKYKNRSEDDSKDFKDKGKKSCYIAEEETRDDSGEHDDEVEDEFDEDEAIALVTCVKKKNDR